jgi:hypothetical protein
MDQAKDAIRACCADDWCRKTGNDNMAYALKDGDALEKFCRAWRQRQPSYRHTVPLTDAERGGEPSRITLADLPAIARPN